VPFRLLAFAADPEKASDLCGQAFARYAASGIDITLVCAAARGWSGAEHAPAAHQLGVRHLVLLDYRLSELTAAGLEDVFMDVIGSVRPHVVVADGSVAAVRDAAISAFSRIRHATGGSAALPAKLYYRPAAGTASVAVTTAIATLVAPELFVRVFPNPWVTGVLERDLFAGIPIEQLAPSRELTDRLAG
jgi:LmbE family N-acetylglucosaminyl deacetylase